MYCGCWPHNIITQLLVSKPFYSISFEVNGKNFTYTAKCS